MQTLLRGKTQRFTAKWQRMDAHYHPHLCIFCGFVFLSKKGDLEVQGTPRLQS